MLEGAAAGRAWLYMPPAEGGPAGAGANAPGGVVSAPVAAGAGGAIPL